MPVSTLTKLGRTCRWTELHGIALAKREAERGLFRYGRLERKLQRLNMHLIHAEELMSHLSAHSRLNTHPAFIHALRDSGRNQASTWLERNFQLIGTRSSFSLARFLPAFPKLQRAQ